MAKAIDRRRILAALGCVVVVASVFRPGGALAQRVSFAKRGTRLRKALLDSVRPTFERDTRGPVEFVVHRLAVSGRFAFGHVSSQRPGGGRIDWTKTVYAKELREGFFDPGASYFLLRKSNGGWRLVDYIVGPTDVPWEGWRQRFKLPTKLFLD